MQRLFTAAEGERYFPLPTRRPPVPLAQKMHGCWYQDDSNEGDINQHSQSAAQTERFDKNNATQHKGTGDNHHEEGGAGDNTTRPFQAFDNAFPLFSSS